MHAPKASSVALIAITLSNAAGGNAQTSNVQQQGGYATIQIEGGLGNEYCGDITVYNGPAICGPMAIPNRGVGYSQGMGNYGATSGTAYLQGQDVSGVWARGAGFGMDYLTFGGGIVPTNVVFWLSVRTSFFRGAPPSVPAYGEAATDFYVNWGSSPQNFTGTVGHTWSQWFNNPNPYGPPGPGLGPVDYYLNNVPAPSPGPTPGGTINVQTNGANGVRFYMSSAALVGGLYGQSLHLPYRAVVQSAARITGIQFYRSGVDVSSQVTAQFASGNNYHIGAPLTPVPEPGTTALLALGLGILALVRRRRRPPSAGDTAAHRSS